MIEDLSWQRPIAPIQLCGSRSGLTFEAYIIRRVVPQLWPGACLVLDNSSIHQGDEIEAAVKAVGASLIYLPPYSPDFSPVENFWSKVKTILNSVGARTYQALQKAIEIAYDQVSLKDIHNWFTFRCYCTSPT